MMYIPGLLYKKPRFGSFYDPLSHVQSYIYMGRWGHVLVLVPRAALLSSIGEIGARS
jgi:hypothetical protein